MPTKAELGIIPFDFNNQKLIIWTNHKNESESIIQIKFVETDEKDGGTPVTLVIRTQSQEIQLEHCYHETEFPSNVAVTGNDTWTITKGTVDTVITCNNVEVVRINYEEESPGHPSCFSHFVNKNFISAHFMKDDSATFAYKIEDAEHGDQLGKFA